MVCQDPAITRFKVMPPTYNITVIADFKVKKKFLCCVCLYQVFYLKTRKNHMKVLEKPRPVCGVYVEINIQIGNVV